MLAMVCRPLAILSQPVWCALPDTSQLAAHLNLLQNVGGKATKIIGDSRLRLNLKPNSCVFQAKKIKKRPLLMLHFTFPMASVSIPLEARQHDQS